jgi:predicted ATPase
MNLAYSFSLEPIGALDGNNYEVRIQKSVTSPEVTLVDIGYGLADLLPLLVHCYYTPEGSTLILEQPGVHLHPKAQADLADLLIEIIAERNLQILVESHSEHLLNRLQRRIAEEKISVDKTALHFCRNDEGISNIEQLKLDEFGNIANWPENFFGDEMGDLFAMTEAQRERQKRAEG